MTPKQFTINDIAEMLATAFNKQDAWLKAEFIRVRVEFTDKIVVLEEKLTVQLSLISTRIDELDERLTVQIANLSIRIDELDMRVSGQVKELDDKIVDLSSAVSEAIDTSNNANYRATNDLDLHIKRLKHRRA